MEENTLQPGAEGEKSRKKLSLRLKKKLLKKIPLKRQLIKKTTAKKEKKLLKNNC